MYWLIFVVVIVALFLITRLVLRGEDLKAFDKPSGERFDLGPGPNSERDEVVASLGLSSGPILEAPRKERIGLMRKYIDGLADGLDLPATFTSIEVNGVPAEWVMAEGADPARRVLYLHGGAFIMGSPLSHRNVTSHFSKVTGASVLALDYRLMPENSRMAGVEDSRNAYRWLLDNGPQGRGPATRMYVAGDSAGGNLTLSLIAWVRDQKLRKVDAAVAFSPLTDSTMAGPSIRGNMDTDPMLGPMFATLAKVPSALLLWSGLFQNRVNPSNPVVSPVYGDLSNLPPTLLQVSESEMLFDDSRRYVNRAIAAGSPVRLQSWAHMVHVFQMFVPKLSESVDAWDEVGKFINEVG